MIEEKIENEDAQAYNTGFCVIVAEVKHISINLLLGCSSGRSFSI
jgi:hypothetical protein